MIPHLFNIGRDTYRIVSLHVSDTVEPFFGRLVFCWAIAHRDGGSTPLPSDWRRITWDVTLNGAPRPQMDGPTIDRISQRRIGRTHPWQPSFAGDVPPFDGECWETAPNESFPNGRVSVHVPSSPVTCNAAQLRAALEHMAAYVGDTVTEDALAVAELLPDALSIRSLGNAGQWTIAVPPDEYELPRSHGLGRVVVFVPALVQALATRFDKSPPDTTAALQLVDGMLRISNAADPVVFTFKGVVTNGVDVWAVNCRRALPERFNVSTFLFEFAKPFARAVEHLRSDDSYPSLAHVFVDVTEDNVILRACDGYRQLTQWLERAVLPLAVPGHFSIPAAVARDIVKRSKRETIRLDSEGDTFVDCDSVVVEFADGLQVRCRAQPGVDYAVTFDAHCERNVYALTNKDVQGVVQWLADSKYGGNMPPSRVQQQVLVRLHPRGIELRVRLFTFTQVRKQQTRNEYLDKHRHAIGEVDPAAAAIEQAYSYRLLREMFEALAEVGGPIHLRTENTALSPVVAVADRPEMRGQLQKIQIMLMPLRIELPVET
jgi:hypothetical protein